MSRITFGSNSVLRRTKNLPRRVYEYVAPRRTNESDSETRRSQGGGGDLAKLPKILQRVARDLERAGLAARDDEAKLLYLVMMSRVLGRPVSVVLKGQSAVGKSFLVERVLGLFPESAYLRRTAMSDKALIYSKEPLSHRVLVIYEMDGIPSGQGEYILRSLISEGHIDYEVTVPDEHGEFTTQRVYREGPTGLILTTTRSRVHQENETRLISIELDDSPDITKKIMMASATEHDVIDTDEWHALQEWIAGADHNVVISYFETLVDRIPAVAPRLQRDVPTLKSLIESHAILHQQSRERDASGRIVATLDDYAVVRHLYAPWFSQGAQVAVAPLVRATVHELIRLWQNKVEEPVSNRELAVGLKVSEGTASRRVERAVAEGYIINLEEGGGAFESQLVPGVNLPEDYELLPTVATLKDALEGGDRR